MIDIKAIDLLLDIIIELLWEIDNKLIDEDRHEQLKLLCALEFGLDYSVPPNLIGFATDMKEMVDNFLLEKREKDHE